MLGLLFQQFTGFKEVRRLPGRCTRQAAAAGAVAMALQQQWSPPAALLAHPLPTHPQPSTFPLCCRCAWCRSGRASRLWSTRTRCRAAWQCRACRPSSWPTTGQCASRSRARDGRPCRGARRRRASSSPACLAPQPPRAAQPAALLLPRSPCLSAPAALHPAAARAGPCRCRSASLTLGRLALCGWCLPLTPCCFSHCSVTLHSV